MVTRAQIENFLSQKAFAVAGVSRNPKKFGNYIYKTMSERGFKVFALNPHTDMADGIPCYKNLDSLPADVGALIISTKEAEALKLAVEALSKGIRNIWFQQGSCKPETVSRLTTQDNNLIAGKCILMFAGPVTSIHKFHRNILKLFGRLPR